MLPLEWVLWGQSTLVITLLLCQGGCRLRVLLCW